MRIYVTQVFVSDQLAALAFYTKILGFREKHRVPIGDDYWLTVVSPEDPDGCQLLLEPDTHPAVGVFKSALAEDGIPAASFAVDNVQTEYERLCAEGVRFVQPPQEVGGITSAVLDDSFGNLIQLIAL